MTSSEDNRMAKLSPAKAEQKMGEAIFGKDYVGPRTEEAKNEDPYTPTTWGKYDEELIVRSGQRCRVKKLDLPDLIAAGMMDRLNTLEGVVSKNIRQGKGQPPLDPMKMLKDKRTGAQFGNLIDEVVVLVVTAPKLHLPPEKFSDRVEGLVYVDTVSFTDKIEVFQHAMGGLESLAKFRGFAGESSSGVDDEPGDEMSAKSDS